MLAAVGVRDLAARRGRIAARIGVDTGVVVIEGVGARRARRASPASRCGRRRACGPPPRPGQVLLGPATADGGGRPRRARRRCPAAIAVRRRGLLDAGSRRRRRADGLVGRERALAELASIAERSASRFVPGRRQRPGRHRQVGARRALHAGLDGVVGRRAVLRPAPQRARRCTRSARCCPSCSTAAPSRRPAPCVAALRAALGRRRAAARRRRRRRRRPVDARAPRRAARRTLASGLRRADQPGVRAASSSAATSSPRSPSARSTGPRRARWPRRRRRASAGCASTTLNEIADRAGGVPLHVEALTRAVLDARRVDERACRRRCTTR